jgi:hypothetical protein
MPFARVQLGLLQLSPQARSLVTGLPLLPRNRIDKIPIPIAFGIEYRILTVSLDELQGGD